MRPILPALPPRLRADCTACHGLCCVALPFDAAQGFPFDKAAGQACPHLRADFRCAIHDRRHELGFGGCGGFDCHGAGQRASRLPGPPAGRIAAFLRLRPLHDTLARLALARHYVDAPLADEMAALAQALDTACEQAGAPTGALQARARALLARVLRTSGPWAAESAPSPGPRPSCARTTPPGPAAGRSPG